MKKVEIKNNKIRLEYKNKYLEKIEWFNSLKNSSYKYWDNIIQDYISDCREYLEYLDDEKIIYIFTDTLSIDITHLIDIYVKFVINSNLHKLDYLTYKKLNLKYLILDTFKDKSNLGFCVKDLLELNSNNNNMECNTKVSSSSNNKVSYIIHSISYVKGTQKQKIKYNDASYELKINKLFETLGLNYADDYIEQITLTFRYNGKSTTRDIKGKLKPSNYIDYIFKGFNEQPNKEINNTFSKDELTYIIKNIKEE